MNKKKIGLIVVVLFLLIGLGSFVFANPNEEENLKKKGKDIEETETIKDKDSGEDESTETTDDDGNQVLTNNNATRTINNNRNNGNNNGSNNNGGTGNIVVDNGYDEALKAVEKAESSFTQGDVDNAKELVDKVTDPQGKEELKDRLDAVQDAIDADKLVTELENKVKNSNNITDMNGARDYRTESEVEKIVSELKDSTLKDELEERLETVGKILNDNDSPNITGINDNSFARKNVTLTIEDANDFTTKVTLDGKEIEYTGTFTEEGTYVVTVVDAAFNERTLTFTIDKTPPTVTGVEDGAYYRKDVTPIIEDENLQNVVVKYNGKKLTTYKLGDTLTKEGTYQIRVTDKAGNKFDYITFTIDKTAPTVTGVEDGAYYRKDVTPIIKDENLQNVVVKYNGKKLTTYKLGDTLTKEGTYQIRVTDKAGNKFDYITFTIDKTAPVVTGATNGGYYRKDVTLTITEENIQNAKYQYNGKWYSFESGHTFTEEGTYFVRVTDKAYNKKAELTFTIDKTAPTVTGVEDGAYYRKDVTPIIEDENLQNVVVKYNGKKLTTYKLGDTLTKEGTYQIRVTDKAGNKFDYITFTIDKTAPVVTGATNGESYREDVTLTITEENIQNAKYQYNGKWYSFESGHTFTEEGTYFVRVTDKAYNKKAELTFTIDKTAPVVKSLGITDINEFKDEVGKLYAKNGDTVRVLIYFDEKLGTEPTVKLGGKEFTATYREASSINDEAYYADIKLTEEMKLSDGVLSFEVYGYTDKIGNIGVDLTEKDVNMTAYPSVTIDNTLPVLNFNNGFITNGYTVEATDDNFAYMTVQYYDGREMQTIESNTFTLDKEGDNTRYNIKAYDKAGNVSEYRDIYLDNANPVISGTAKNAGEDVSIENNGIYQEVALNISDGSLKKVSLVKEDGSEEELATYKDNYTNKKITFEKQYTEEGTYTIKAVDRNKNESTITFTIDKTPASRVYSTLDFDKSGKQYYEIDKEKVYYVKNGDSFIFRMQFSEALKTAPTVKVGGMIVPMTLNEKFLNNEGKYIYEGTVNITQEAKITQGRLEIVLSNVIDLAGNESTDEVVLNQTPTSNGRVVVYDVTSPGPTILGITGFFNENEDAHYITYGKKVRVLTYYKEKLSVNPIVKIGNKEFETYYTEDSSDLKNGVYAYYADITITEDLGLNEGEIPFTVSGHKDLAGNEGRTYTNTDITYGEKQEYENRFNKVVLDNTNPSISIEGTTGEKYWFREQTFNVVVTEANLDSIYYAWNQSSNDKNMHNILDSDKATKVESKDIIDNGDGTYTVKITIAKEGRYVLNVKAVDKAGNSTYTRKGWYQIDRTNPTIVLHKNSEEKEITPGIHNYCVSATVSDDHMKSIKLNDADYESDTMICGDGNYTLTATDKAENTKTINFQIDRTAPIIDINGTQFKGEGNNGGHYNSVELKVIEDNDYTTWVNDKEVNIAEYDFNVDGEYTVKVRDKAGTNTIVKFTVDTIPATLVELRVNSSNTNKDVAKLGDYVGVYLNVDEELREDPTFVINGETYVVNQTATPNETFKYYRYAVLFQVTDATEEGEVEFTISNIYDKAGNKLNDLTNTNANGKVFVDKTAPKVNINNWKELTLEVGDTYKDEGATAIDNLDGDVTSNIQVSYLYYDENGKRILPDPTEIKLDKAGEFVIKYTVTDRAGNRREATRRIKVVKGDEAPVLTGVETGGTYTGSITYSMSDDSGSFKLYYDLGHNYQTCEELIANGATMGTIHGEYSGTYQIPGNYDGVSVCLVDSAGNKTFRNNISVRVN